jgi:hypothetical protein
VLGDINTELAPEVRFLAPSLLTYRLILSNRPKW